MNFLRAQQEMYVNHRALQSSAVPSQSSSRRLEDELLDLLHARADGHVDVLVTDVNDEAADDGRVEALLQQQLLALLQRSACTRGCLEYDMASSSRGSSVSLSTASICMLRRLETSRGLETH